MIEEYAEPVLRAQELKHSYGAIQAVRGIDLAVRPGELFGLVGPDGAGKSTTISCFAGLLAPSAGSVRVLGQNPLARGSTAREQVGLLPQQYSLYGDLSGKDAIVVGRSILVGKPMGQLLLGANCTVTMAHSRTKDLPGLVRRAGIVVAAVGRAEMVKGDWIKPGAIVIDVGINRLPPGEGEAKGRLVGDVDYAEAAGVADAITPVPGGVGPMTIACLLRNTLVAAHRRAGLAVGKGF